MKLNCFSDLLVFIRENYIQILIINSDSIDQFFLIVNYIHYFYLYKYIDVSYFRTTLN